MIVSKYKRELIEKRKRKARKLYKRGLTTREVGAEVKRSHAWVALAVKSLPKY